jgi:hypothetical protein
MPIKDAIFVALEIQPKGVAAAKPWTAGFKQDARIPLSF